MKEEFLEIGIVRALYRYPVKSMRGEGIAEALVGWYGIEGDRRYAFVRTGNETEFPWLTARQVPKLIRYTPYYSNPADLRRSPVRVKTADGKDLALESEELHDDIARLYKREIHLIHLKNGIFDCMNISLITTSTLCALGHLIGYDLDPRRFRPNILVETFSKAQFVEDCWVGGLLIFGDQEDAAHVRADKKDLRCMIVNLDPNTAQQDPRILKKIVNIRDNFVGIYGTVEKPGTIKVGDVIHLSVGGPVPRKLS